MLLRSCASYSKLVYNARTSPAASIAAELHLFDQDVRGAFCELMRLSPDEDTWARAQWATSLGGLGLRSCMQHAHAAFAASVVNSASLQCAIWPALSVADVLAEPAAVAAFTALAPRLPQALSMALASGEKVSQKRLSQALDRAAFDEVLLHPATPQH